MRAAKSKLENTAERRAVLAILGSLLAGALVVFAFWPLGIPLLLIPFVMLWVLRRLQQPDQIVLWFRRFHQEDLKASRFPYFLRSAALGLFVPITIRDTKVKHNRLVNPVQLVLRFYLSQLLIIMVLPLVLLTLFFSIKGVFSDRSQETFWTLIIGIVLLALFIWSFRALFRWFRTSGKYDLSTEKGKLVMDRIISGIRERRGIFVGPVVLKCSDAIWQEVVRYFLKSASAVIIDVGELNKNVEWELEQTLTVFSPEAIILAISVDSSDDQALLKEKMNSLRARFGDALVDKAGHFVYESRLRGNLLGQYGSFRPKAKELRQLVIGALESSSMLDKPDVLATASGSWRHRLLRQSQWGFGVLVLAAVGYLLRWPEDGLSPSSNTMEEAVLVAELPAYQDWPTLSSFANTIGVTPFKGTVIGFSGHIPGKDAGKNVLVRWNQQETEIKMINTDDFFLSAFKAYTLAGRAFNWYFDFQKTPFILNESAALLMFGEDYAQAVGDSLEVDGKRGKIVGVVKNLEMGAGKEEAVPTILSFEPQELRYLCIKGTFDTASVLPSLGRIWHTSFKEPLGEVIYLTD